MKKFIINSNRKYDSLKEPWRFLIVTAMVFPAIALLSSQNKFAILAGALWFLIVVLWRMAGDFLTDI